MNLSEEEILNYKRHHKYDREKFITEITMMHEVAVEMKEKPRIKIARLNSATELELIKAHKFYWDRL